MLIDTLFVTVMAFALWKLFSAISDNPNIAMVLTIFVIASMSTGWRIGAVYALIDNLSCTVNEYSNDPGFIYWAFHPREWFRCL